MQKRPQFCWVIARLILLLLLHCRPQRNAFWIAACLMVGMISPACTAPPDADILPKGILPHAKMVDMQVAIQLREAQLSLSHIAYPEAKQLFDIWLDSAAKAKGTDSSTYSKSLHYYATNIALMDAVYEQVVDSLGTAESKAKGGK